MAITIQIKDETTNRTQSVSVDFVTDLLSQSVGTPNNELQYFFIFSTGARDTDNKTFTSRVVLSLNDLALNKQYRSALVGGLPSSTPYANIKEMITDYVYDYIHGHTEDQYGSGVTYKAPLKF